ncbi:Deoxyuridine 5'-triphosphate nucleotidohydrolase [Fusarium oxysporum f. sp. albedinis]|nr:Deoxyuridine 5'-triphosphate nucleotidohydrolase [Fusarium oxysporum f. sp. albedinis]
MMIHKHITLLISCRVFALLRHFRTGKRISTLRSRNLPQKIHDLKHLRFNLSVFWINQILEVFRPLRLYRYAEIKHTYFKALHTLSNRHSMNLECSRVTKTSLLFENRLYYEYLIPLLFLLLLQSFSSFHSSLSYHSHLPTSQHSWAADEHCLTAVASSGKRLGHPCPQASG